MKKYFNKFYASIKKSWAFIKKHYVKIGFYFLAFIFIINAILMTVFLINRNYKYRLLNKLYIEAILPEQNLEETLFTGIARIEQIDYDEIAIGDQVVFCCDMGADQNWVQEVVAVNRDNNTLQTTYNGTTSANVTEDEVFGVYLNNANIVGTFYYTSMFPRGYILLILSQIFLLTIYHYSFIQKKIKEIIGKSKIDESDVADETD